MACNRNNFVMPHRPPKGIPHADIAPGDTLFASPCKCCGDQRYTLDIWNVLAVTPTHITLKADTVIEVGHSRPVILLLRNYEFYDASLARQQIRLETGQPLEMDIASETMRRGGLKLCEKNFLGSHVPRTFNGRM
jgi:hypothetical protein